MLSERAARRTRCSRGARQDRGDGRDVVLGIIETHGRPGLLLVDELAHTNAPGSRHAKRWQDVEELLDAGISLRRDRTGFVAAVAMIALCTVVSRALFGPEQLADLVMVFHVVTFAVMLMVATVISGLASSGPPASTR